MIWTAAAIHSLPVALLDVVIAAFLLHLANKNRSARLRRATFALGAWYVLLFVLNGMHVVSCVLTNPIASFWANHVGESIAVLLSIVPLVAFVYSFAASEEPSAVDERFAREGRVALMVWSVLSGALSLGFLAHSVVLDDATVFYRVAVEHAETDGLSAMWGQSLSLLVLLGYAFAASVLLRRGLHATGPARRSTLMFALIVAAGVAAVVVNRLESDGLLPMGTYATFVLFANLLAIVIFMGHSAELTSFAERIVGITLALVLVALGAAGEIIVHLRGEREDAVRAARVERAAALVGEGRDDDAVRVSGAVRLERDDGHDGHDRRDGAIASAREAQPGAHDARTLADTVIVEPIVTPDGEEARLVFAYAERARAVDPVARSVALGMIIASVLCVLGLRRLFERSVLVPLRQLERADASSRAKSLFIAQLSHELRTPLSAVVGHARTLVDDLADPASRERASRISDAAEVLLSLVEGLIEEGKADLATLVARNEDVTLRPLVEGIVELARPRARPDVALTIEIAADVPVAVRADPRLVRQILLNLLTNAAKHTHAGIISVHARVVEARSDSVALSVEDTGTGIPASEHARIFEPFHQVASAPDAPDGAGLGLAIVQRMADALGTRVHVESEPGRGSRFSFALPSVHVAPDPGGDESREPVLVPAGVVRAELRELALVGDVLTLQQRAAALARDDARFAPFAARVSVLARDYQVRALQSLLAGDA